MMHINNTNEILPIEKKTIETQTNSRNFSKISVFVPYNCFYCMKTLSHVNDLEEHRNSCKGVSESSGKYEHNKNLDSITKMIFSFSSTERFPCKICTQDFESENMLQLHLLLGHQENWK